MTTDRFHVVIASPGLPHQGDTLQQRSLGGSETAAICMAEALASLGHRVHVFSPCQGGRFGDARNPITYRPMGEFVPWAAANPHDVTVVSRDMGALQFALAGKMAELWCHDLALRRFRTPLAQVVHLLDAILVMSAFQKTQFLRVYEGLPTDLIVETRNGVHLAAFRSVRGLVRSAGKLVYGSRPERGLEAALNVMDVLAQRGTKHELHVSTYDNPHPSVQPLQDMLHARARTMRNVVLHGPLRQDQWRAHLATGALLLYPGTPGEFREISCIAAIEAQAAGTPAVAIDRGALRETLGRDDPEGAAGVFVGDDATDPNSRGHAEAMADAIMGLTGRGETHAPAWAALAKAGLRRAERYDWRLVAAEWVARWQAKLAQRSGNAERLLRHAVRTGDRELAAFVGQGGGGAEWTAGAAAVQ